MYITRVVDNTDGTATISCSCGEKVTYRGVEFTNVEAQRHRRWHEQQEGRG